MSRSERRHQQERIKDRVRGYYHEWAVGDPKPERVIGKVANTRKLCSCWACVNPRKHFRKRTRQEVISQLSED